MRILDEIANIDENFKERPSQKEMAKFINGAVNDKTTEAVIVEGAVGIGKSLGYTFASLLNKREEMAGRSLIISTSGLVLQEQLINKDLPFVNWALWSLRKDKITFTSLKGINNYLCKRKFELNMNPDLVHMPEERPDGVTPDEWSAVSSTSDECFGKKCSHYEECFHKARKSKAESSDVVVVNHHLLAADMFMGGTLLPKKSVIIVDEAHNLERIAINFSETRLSKHSFLKLLQMFDETVLRSDYGKLLEGMVGSVLSKITTREIDQLIADAKSRVEERKLFDKPFPIEGLWEKFKAVTLALEAFLSEKEDNQIFGFLRSYASFYSMICNLREIPEEKAIWLEGEEIKFLDVDVKERLKNYWENCDSKLVFASATLTTGGNFEFIKNSLGLETLETLETDFHSPFNIEEQMKTVIVPENVDPRSETFPEDVIQSIDYVLSKSPYKKTLILCTSNKMMEDVYSHVSRKFHKDFTILVQSKEKTKSTLLSEFASTPNCILIGQSASFGEGVDIHGNKNIIITKINFVPPDSPVQIVKERIITKRGGDPFSELTLPEAILKTKQQVGRGIRTTEDNVVLAILDNRVLHKRGWGSMMRRSLPRITHNCPFLGKRGQ